MKKIKFTARSKKDKMRFFTFFVTGEIKWPKNENVTKAQIISHIKESMAEEWSKGSFYFTPNDVIVKLGT